MPELPKRDIQHRRKEEDCALDRLVTAIAYKPTGRVADPQFTIRSNDCRSERDVQRYVRPKPISEQSTAQLNKSGALVKEADVDFAPRQIELNVNVTDDIRELAETRRERLKEAGLVTESYRFIRPDDALKCL